MLYNIQVFAEPTGTELSADPFYIFIADRIRFVVLVGWKIDCLGYRTALNNWAIATIFKNSEHVLRLEGK